jgi:hypothetical protein
VGDISGTIERADEALIAWRERWEKPAEVHSPDYVPPEEEGGDNYAAGFRHPFTPLEGNSLCNICGGGKLHPIHD